MNVTPDGVRYLHVARGERVARPFHFRWLVPRLCGMSDTNWRAIRTASLLALVPVGCWYGGFGWRGLFVAAVPLGLAGVWAFNWEWPVLVDAPAMCLALISATCAMHGLWYVAIPVALIAGATKETAPLFAALWAWSWVPLLGFLAVAVRAVQRPGDDVLDAENAWILRHPYEASRKYHKALPAYVWALPWGACLIGLAHLSWPLVAVLVAAYAQCAVATDTVRLYQWAWPMLAVATSLAVDTRWLLPLAVVHLVNPFQTNGG